jgi:tetratricopeptide (TPR) repeat protein
MTGRQDLFDESMRLGHSAAWEMQWPKAIEYYRKALAEFPDHPQALSNLALALLETDQLDEALVAYQRVSIVSPQDPIPIEKSAEVHERMGHFDEAVGRRSEAAELYIQRKDAGKAVDNWSHIARLAPDDLRTRSKLAVTYERLGRRNDAVYEYLAVASILQRAKKVDRAKEALQRALMLVPGDPEATLSMRLLQQGKDLPPPSPPKGATAPLRMARVQEFLQSEESKVPDEEGQQADPETTAQGEALTILAGLLFEDSPDDEEHNGSTGIAAITSGKGGSSKSKGQSAMYRYLGQAIDLQTRGHNQQAIKDFNRALEAGLDHPAAHYNLGILYKEEQSFDEARRHLSLAVGHPNLALGANLALGRLARLGEDLEEAARHLLQALKIADSLTVEKGESNQLDQFYDTILASQGEGNEEDLAKIVESTLNFLSGPEWMDRLRQARHQLDSTQVEGGEVVPIAEMLAVGGTDRVLKSLKRISELRGQQLYDSAMEEAMLALDFAPTYLALHRTMAEILIDSDHEDDGYHKLGVIAQTHQIRGEFPQAVEVYQSIIEHSPIDVQARANLIQLLQQQDRTEEALSQYFELAELYRQMADNESARSTLEEALQIAKHSYGNDTWTLKILHEMGDIDLSRLDQRKALAVYQEIQTLDPSDQTARQIIIDLNLRLGKEVQAAQELDEYLEYLVQRGQGPEALQLLEELAREHPGKQALHLRLAEAYKAAGRTADAIAQYDALGEIQLDAGQVEDAILSIQAIIDLDPPDVEGYQELINNLKSGR